MREHLRHFLQFSRVYARWICPGHLRCCRVLASLHAAGEVELGVVPLVVTAVWSGIAEVLVAPTPTTRSPLLVILIISLLVVSEPTLIIARVLLLRRPATLIFPLILLLLRLALILLTIIVGLLLLKALRL